jgi:hypothetical protein
MALKHAAESDTCMHLFTSINPIHYHTTSILAPRRYDFFRNCHTWYSRHKPSQKSNRSSPKEPDLPVTGVQDGKPRVTSRRQLHYRRCGHGGMIVVWRPEQWPQHTVGLHRSPVCAQLTASQPAAIHTVHKHSTLIHSIGTLSSNTVNSRSGIWAQDTR